MSVLNCIDSMRIRIRGWIQIQIRVAIECRSWSKFRIRIRFWIWIWFWIRIRNTGEKMSFVALFCFDRDWQEKSKKMIQMMRIHTVILRNNLLPLIKKVNRILIFNASILICLIQFISWCFLFCIQFYCFKNIILLIVWI
jgi:hypothetical protein